MSIFSDETLQKIAERHKANREASRELARRIEDKKQKIRVVLKKVKEEEERLAAFHRRAADWAIGFFIGAASTLLLIFLFALLSKHISVAV